MPYWEWGFPVISGLRGDMGIEPMASNRVEHL